MIIMPYFGFGKYNIQKKYIYNYKKYLDIILFFKK